jgi:hypothetical protein
LPNFRFEIATLKSPFGTTRQITGESNSPRLSVLCRQLLVSSGIDPTRWVENRRSKRKMLWEGVGRSPTCRSRASLRKLSSKNADFHLTRYRKGVRFSPSGTKWEAVVNPIPPVEAARANWVIWPNARCNRILAPTWGGISGFPPLPETK